ncbi:MAG: hypothetical protein KGY46_09100 [Anaerolineales bacterium]|nr:hypothetical protein [Anaerolineales bacterium]
MQSEDCFYLGEKENKRGEKEYYVFLGSADNGVTPAFEDMEELRDHLANLGTSHGQPWSMGAVVLLEKHKKIPREIGFIKPYNSNYRHQYESWKANGGECGSAL